MMEKTMAEIRIEKLSSENYEIYKDMQRIVKDHYTKQ
jgi:hypothetical protein